MQYNFNCCNKEKEINLYDTLTDYIYAIDKEQKIGIFGSVPLSLKCEEKKDGLQKCNEILNWVKQNVVNGHCREKIIKTIIFLLKYVDNVKVANVFDEYHITGLIPINEKDSYSVYIAFNDIDLTILTTQKQDKKISSTSITINLEPKDSIYHSVIDDTTVETRFYEINDVAFKKIESFKTISKYESKETINHSITQTTSSLYQLNNEKEGKLLENKERIVTKYPLRLNKAFAIKQEDKIYDNETSTYNTSKCWYLARNNSAINTIIVVDNAKYLISKNKLKKCLSGKIDIDKLLQESDQEHFENIVHLSKALKEKYFK